MRSVTIGREEQSRGGRFETEAEFNTHLNLGESFRHSSKSIVARIVTQTQKTQIHRHKQTLSCDILGRNSICTVGYLHKSNSK